MLSGMETAVGEYQDSELRCRSLVQRRGAYGDNKVVIRVLGSQQLKQMRGAKSGGFDNFCGLGQVNHRPPGFDTKLWVGGCSEIALFPQEAPRWPLPVKRLSLPSTKPQLSEEQAAVLRAVLKGQSIFFTGSAGTGKSYLLKRILGSLPPTGTVATASTGVAACHIGGTTLHAFAGIGSGQAPLAQCVALAQRPGVRQGWLNCQRLVIDEISMVEADLFDKLEAVARAVRQQNKPFGGIQLIICGDFLQLPPVTKGFQPPRFCFQAKSWKRCVPVTLELTKVWRQADQTFISLLQAVRLGRCSDEVTRQLQATASHKVGRDGIVATRLCTHQDDVALTNERRLQELPGKVHRFEAMDSNPELASILDAQCPVSQLLQLKLGAQVMLVKNLSVSRGLVNGARGVVVGFEAEGRGLPQVRFLCGVTEVIRADRWTVQATRNQLLSRQQLPLQLAWAMSIHKSQGMTLDCVEISLGRVFASGQAYVALSRARSLQGLRVLDFDPVAVRCDPRVLHFYATLQRGRGLSLVRGRSGNEDRCSGSTSKQRTELRYVSTARPSLAQPRTNTLQSLTEEHKLQNVHPYFKLLFQGINSVWGH
uniref:ATP-dependent DNA helicase PIF1 n=1 Tax=Mandrillus leucophaeus TaxID=9568 RepID=A0A2K5ZH30_MANLE